MASTGSRPIGDAPFEQVPCQWCKTMTPMLGTQMCDRCYELNKRITANPELARLMLAKIGSASAS